MNKQIDTYSAYAIWNIQETFLELPYHFPEFFPDGLNPVRKTELITGRMLVKMLCEKMAIPFEGVRKNGHGKPYLKESDAHLSISHSFPLATAMIHLKRPCGIDVEQPKEKHLAVQHKFLHESERQFKDNMEMLCMIWCAKEVIYKLYGRRPLSFKDEIKVRFQADNTMTAKILKLNHDTIYQIHYEWVKGYLLAYGT